MSKVFLLNPDKTPLNPIHPAQARQLLNNGKAAVFRRYPFSLILKNQRVETAEPLRFKIDPGAKYTGLSVVNDATGELVFGAELQHRGFQIRNSLTSRRQLRRSRRNRKTRYRAPRFNNRTRPDGWLAPSIQSRIDNIETWLTKIRKLANVAAISQELVRFDMQRMQNPEVSGVEYQQGTLAGYEAREYLLQKWGRKCAYCKEGKGENVPLQIEHIIPRAKGGSNRISNLTLACENCNKQKGTKDISVFLAKKPELLKKILSQARIPLADAAAVNTTRFALLKALQATGLPVETGSGALTKFNRTQRGLEKTHVFDSACVGESTPLNLMTKHCRTLIISAKGHGNRQACRTDKFGFPIRHCSSHKFHFGFQTGDIVKASVQSGKKIGEYVGRIATRATGSFNISTKDGLIEGISHKSCKTIHKKDGYNYSY